jgi:hypothetical protein
VALVDYRRHLRAVIAASAAPYGYTLTIWTAGAVTTHAEGIPSALDAMLLLAGAVAAFGAIGAFAYGGVNSPLVPGARGQIRIWGGIHLPSVGASILLVALVNSLVHGHAVWPVVGFTATATYLLVITVQFRFAAHTASESEEPNRAPPHPPTER